MILPNIKAIKIPSLNRREKILVVIFLLALLLFLYYQYIFIPQWNNIKKLQAEIKQQQKVLRFRLNYGWNNIPGLKAESEKIKARINKIHLEIPNYQDEPALLVDFYNLAKHNHVEAKTVKFSKLEEVTGKYYSTFKVSLEVTGYNSNIYKFILALESYSRWNRISEATFSPLDYQYSKCNLIVEFYVLHKVQPDPLIYPFMDRAYSKDAPYKIFNIYNQEQAKNSEVSANNTVAPLEPVLPDIIPPEPVLAPPPQNANTGVKKQVYNK